MVSPCRGAQLKEFYKVRSRNPHGIKSLRKYIGGGGVIRVTIRQHGRCGLQGTLRAAARGVILLDSNGQTGCPPKHRTCQRLAGNFLPERSLKMTTSLAPRQRIPRAFFLAATAFLLTAATFALRAQNASPGPQAPQAPRQTGPSSDAPPPVGNPPAPSASPVVIPAPLPKGKKLILKDGSNQLVREYQREGDRVRYYSVERSAWEEIPASLVDWDATQAAEAYEQAQQKDLADKSKNADAAARFADLDVDRSLQVRPGVFLPDGVGLYVLDGQTVVNLPQDAATSQINKGREAEKIITGVPFIPSKHQIEIPGKQAKLRVHALDPEFYFRTADGREPEISLLRAEVKNEKRQLMAMTTIAGESHYKGNEVTLREWDAARGVYRYTLDQAVPPGEYAFVESTSEGVALYVWDFGIDPPAGTGAASTAPAAKTKTKPR
jgi:hypothetical protein